MDFDILSLYNRQREYYLYIYRMKTSDFNNIVASERLTLIDFYATWCGACRAMDPTLDRLALAMGDLVTLIRVDTSAISSIPLVRHYNIVSVPTFILFRRSEPLWRDSGIIAYNQLCDIIRHYERANGYK